MIHCARQPEGGDNGMRVPGAVVLLTGASGGIGVACAETLAARGAKVILHGRDADRLSGAAADLGVKALQSDLAEPGAADALADSAREIFGRVDVVVHCAGVGWYGPLEAMPSAAVDDLIEVNLRAPVRITRALLPEMLARRCGHVVFLASIAGWTGVANEALYAATKAGVITFADSLRTELSGTGVGVSTISPAAVQTEFFTRRGVPYGRRFPRPVPPERIASAVVRGVERERAHQMIPRWLVLAPAIRTALPSAFRLLSRRFG
jgi:short-subunit dehydrogenase